ncbi:two-component response regulator-like APRR5 [Cucumis melo var. makuwa]|uniref:Two-component response regulator-like APRR5 n=1 Tax=Cucumis melo var. makuwa TaxID=1194695 RepID=A0A5A7TM57_CUCMM|nr:two-component response regulator-like APRR5 [Cucumis melo var. makuwa]TYK05918.1 two-component response regulator-like APRR5 [Cucumis melo var. makuwa]
MGEAVVVSSEDVDVDVDYVRLHNDDMADAESMGTHRPNRDGSSSGFGIGIKWERFLPKMMLRVLLVEADDSTRQIITALLRKCCYRVAAVPDGLKAWEILKERPRNVDLILAEVELPSISGFALLTLIMEHETCKNIPVIMMSSEDSISTVYKCMMKGAADYLVKPLRRNELRNLWQHVWRRQASSNARTDVQEKVEVTSENETASNHSTGYVAGVQRNDKNIEKGSDTQSSCTKVDFEAGNKIQENSQCRQGKASPNDFKPQKDERHINLSQRLFMHENETGGLAMSCYVNTDLPITLSMGLEPINDGRSPNIASEAGDDRDLLANPSRDATASNHACIKYPDNYQKSSPSNNFAANNFSSALHLDLSLRRCQPNDFEERAAGQAILKHSSASAFTRYTFRPLQSLQAKSSSICDEQKEIGSNPEHIGSIGATSTSDTINPTPNLQKSNTSMPMIASQSTQSEVAKSSTSETAIPLQVSGTDLMSNNQRSGSGHGSLPSHNFYAQRGSPSSPCRTSVTHPELIFGKQTVYPLNLENHNLEQFLNQHRSVSSPASRKIENSGQSAENQGHISPTTDHSANSNVCRGNTTQVGSLGYPSTCGSNSSVDRVGIARVTSESRNEEALFSQGGDSYRSSQREAALTKFRLKRKDRCYEKKVRYESRKKLAEQRPRVKGQFVRRVSTDPLPAETNDNTSNG